MDKPRKARAEGEKKGNGPRTPQGLAWFLPPGGAKTMTRGVEPVKAAAPGR
jgi:hypothetical protein